MNRIEALTERYVEAQAIGNKAELALLSEEVERLSLREQRVLQVRINQATMKDPRIPFGWEFTD